MSRYVKNKGDLEIAYGYDHMTPMGGYFFQVFDKTKKIEEKKTEEENIEAEKVDPSGEGLIINKGFFKGIGKVEMLELMEKHGIKNKSHLKNVALDLPI